MYERWGRVDVSLQSVGSVCSVGTSFSRSISYVSQSDGEKHKLSYPLEIRGGGFGGSRDHGMSLGG